MTDICINRVKSYEYDNVEAGVFEALDILGIQNDLKPGMKVVLKPNLLLGRKPEANATTNPKVLRAIAIWLRNHGIEDIVLIDSPGGPYVRTHINSVYHACEMTKLADVLKLNDNFEWSKVEADGEFATKSFNILQPIQDADYVINVAKLKTHSVTTISAGIKNLFGCIPGLQKPEFHLRYPAIKDFSNMLVELALTVKPNLTIIDGIEAMEGEGPNGGTTKKTEILFASRDLFSQDYVAAKFMGIDPESVPMLEIAKGRGLIESKPNILGDGFEKSESFKLPAAFGGMFLNGVPVFIKGPLNLAANKLLKPLPYLMREKCIGCGKCALNCPAHIIEMSDKRPTFTKRKKCISCFCCQEMCPEKAILVKRKLKY